MVPDKNTNPPQLSMLRPRQSAAFMMTYFAGFLFCILTAHAASNSIIWERGDQIIQLVQQDDASAPPNDHPHSITSGEIAKLLETLRLKYADGDGDSTEVHPEMWR